MANIAKKITTVFFYLLFFLTPLVFFPKTSELFEFNKMVLTYAFTVLIIGTWLVRMVIEKRFIFRKTLLDLPLLMFLASQVLSTIFSIDTRTSLFGYYSRFHGGLASSISYALLYWAYVSNLGKVETKNVLKILFSSAIIVSLWAIFEHFGRSLSCFIMPEFRTFDVSCWVQDVQNRVFATLGQPNWLAAWVTTLIPLTWAFALNSKWKMENGKSKVKNLNFLLWVSLSCVFFTTLLFTKSRSGIFGFVISALIFWLTTGSLWIKGRLKIFNLLYAFLIFNFSFLILSALFGTPWTRGLNQIINSDSSPVTSHQSQVTSSGPALEVWGTESGKIRNIVWRGAIEIWKHYPILGTGVETFAFSYYNFRPQEHNLVSEWDYLYNKAHNEYLNFAATTGTLGLTSYLILIICSLYLFTRNVYSVIISKSYKTPTTKLTQLTIYSVNYLNIALMSGFISILVTNFFGFSVVVVALQFFLYPAFASSLAEQRKESKEHSYELKKLTSLQIFLFIFVLCSMSYVLFAIGKYWYADYLFAQGKFRGDEGNNIASRELLSRAVEVSPKEAIFWDELAQTSATIAVTLQEAGENETALRLSQSAVAESNAAVSLSPANVNIKRNRASMFIKLSVFNPEYLINAKNSLLEASKLAPTEAKIFYNLSITYLRTGDYDNAIKVMKETVAMKPNYYDAHYALSLMYIDVDEKENAKNHLEYILTNINKDDVNARRELEELEI